MDVNIRVDRVSQVLLADGWHTVQKGSFFVGEIIFNKAEDDATVLVPGNIPGGRGEKYGCQWIEGGVVISSPLSSIQAFKVLPSSAVPAVD